MSDPQRESDRQHDDEENQGPNLVLIYSLMALGFLLAIGIAVLIVLPYYRHR